MLCIFYFTIRTRHYSQLLNWPKFNADRWSLVFYPVYFIASDSRFSYMKLRLILLDSYFVSGTHIFCPEQFYAYAAVVMIHWYTTADEELNNQKYFGNCVLSLHGCYIKLNYKNINMLASFLGTNCGWYFWDSALFGCRWCRETNHLKLNTEPPYTNSVQKKVSSNLVKMLLQHCPTCLVSFENYTDRNAQVAASLRQAC